MKTTTHLKLKALTLGVSLALLSMGAQAAEETASIGVSASVAGKCVITSEDMNINFSSYDPIGAHASNPLDTSLVIKTQCTSGTSYSIGLGDGLNYAENARHLTDGENHLEYGLFSDSGKTTPVNSENNIEKTGNGAEQETTIYASIPAGQAVPVGSYLDTVAVTVTY